MIIRNVNKEDLPRILELNEESVPHVGKIDMKKLEWYFNNCKYFWAVEHHNVIVGFMIVFEQNSTYNSINYQYFNAHYKKFEYVDRIAISDGYRRQGVGKMLYNHLIDKTEYNLVTCEVNLKPENPNSVKFHAKMGFKEVAKLSTNSGKQVVSLLINTLS